MRPAEKFYDDAAQRPLLVYRVCEYLKIHQDGCKQCSRMVEGRHGEQCFRGCYMMAEELIAVVNEGLQKPLGTVDQDNVPRPKRNRACARHAGLLAYLMLLLLAAMIWAGVTKPSDGLWCVAFATMLLAASVDTRPEGGDATQIAAPFTSGAVPERQTPQPHPKGQTRSNKSRPVT